MKSNDFVSETSEEISVVKLIYASNESAKKALVALLKAGFILSLSEACECSVTIISKKDLAKLQKTESYKNAKEIYTANPERIALLLWHYSTTEPLPVYSVLPQSVEEEQIEKVFGLALTVNSALTEVSISALESISNTLEKTIKITRRGSNISTKIPLRRTRVKLGDLVEFNPLPVYGIKNVNYTRLLVAV
jgi:hypothetical protein